MDLIKINDNVAVLGNKEGINSLLVKENKDYSFEELLDKEYQTHILEAKTFLLESDVKKILINNKSLKEDFKSAIVVALFGILGIAFTTFVTMPWLYPSFFIGVGLVAAIEVWAITHAIKSYKNMKLNTKDPKETEEALTEANNLLNAKTNELNQLISEAKYRRYTKWEDISKEIYNVFNTTPSKNLDDALNNDLTNTINLDGPTRERKR